MNDWEWEYKNLCKFTNDLETAVESLKIENKKLTQKTEKMRALLERIVKEGIDTSTDGGIRFVQECLDEIEGE